MQLPREVDVNPENCGSGHVSQQSKSRASLENADTKQAFTIRQVVVWQSGLDDFAVIMSPIRDN